jgi:hypothetical protein
MAGISARGSFDGITMGNMEVGEDNGERYGKCY